MKSLKTELPEDSKRVPYPLPADAQAELKAAAARIFDARDTEIAARIAADSNPGCRLMKSRLIDATMAYRSSHASLLAVERSLRERLGA